MKIDANPETQRFTVSCSAIVRVTVRNGAFHEDVGFGKCENAKSKADALDKVSLHIHNDFVTY